MSDCTDNFPSIATVPLNTVAPPTVNRPSTTWLVVIYADLAVNSETVSNAPLTIALPFISKLPLIITGPVNLTSPSETKPPTDLIFSAVIGPVLKESDSIGPFVMNPEEVVSLPSMITSLLNKD